MIEKTLSEHFYEYFSIGIANTSNLKKAVYKLRYDVYNRELGYEKNCPIDNEQDDFDTYSTHAIIQHKASGLYAGCVRLVTPPKINPKAKLPFEIHCSKSFDPRKLELLKEGDNVKVGEVSRLTVLSNFRLRKSDSKTPDGISTEYRSLETSKEGMRYFPFIAIALFFAGASMLKHKNNKYGFVMMEERLARLLRHSEINFIQLGETLDYHGQRALFYIETASIAPLNSELKEFYQSIDKQLAPNIT